MADVVLQNVTKVYPGHGATPALRNLDLSAADGELLVLVGPSGSGKSTALRLIAGLDAMTAGTILIAGRRVNRLPPSERNVAMVFQNQAIYPSMSCYENIAFPLRMQALPPDEIRRRVDAVARRLGAHAFLDRKPGAISGGERQRVAIARALVRQADVFLFDEPLAHLDAALRAEIRAELLSLHPTLRTTTIYVTHDQEEAMSLGSRIAVLRDGVLHQVGEPAAVYHRPADRFVAGFIGTPRMNLWTGRLGGGAGEWWLESPFGRWPLPCGQNPTLAHAVGSNVVAGLRPENLCVVQPRASVPCDSRPEDAGPSVDIAGRVESVEMLGDRTNLGVTTSAGLRLAVRVDSNIGVSVGTAVTLQPDVSQVHIFRAEGNGERLN